MPDVLSDIKNFLIHAQIIWTDKQKQVFRSIYRQWLKDDIISSFKRYLKDNPIKNSKLVSKQIHKANKLNVTIVSVIDDDYPELLLEIYDFPLVLYCLGNVKRLKDNNKIAMVGTRKPTYDAQKMCDMTARFLAPYHFTIVSGLAFGVDALAHRSALSYGCDTIAVLATAVDDITPKSNIKLAMYILKRNGLIISEYPFGDTLHNGKFVARNRIVSGLCQKVFIVEGGKNSGSMTTAEHALDQNRDLFVMPGSISNPSAVGTNALLRCGALPVIEPDDLLLKEERVDTNVNYTHPIAIRLFEEGAMSMEKLAALMNLPLSILLAELMMLECDGIIAIRDQNVFLV